MKKVMYVLLLAQSAFLMAQKVVVTPYGEKVTVATGANNGLSTTAGDVQLGGTLIKPTKITTSAANSLEINSGGTSASPVSALKLVDGNQGAGKVLTSDANGLATWQLAKTTIIGGVVPDAPFTGATRSDAQDKFTAYTGCNITLPPGKWRLEFGSWIQIGGSGAPEGWWSSIFFSTSNSTYVPLTLANGLKLNSIIIPDLYSNSTKDKYGTGMVFVDLTAKTGDTTIYLWAYAAVQSTGTPLTTTNVTLTSMNGLAGGFGPYTYLVASNID
jgi:hypothetical protein